MNVKPRSAIGEIGELTGQAAAGWIRSHGAEEESEIYLDGKDGAARQGEWKSVSATDGAAPDDQKIEPRAERPPKASRKRPESKQSLKAGVETRSSKRRRNMG
jgi:hypothetical protein